MHISIQNSLGYALYWILFCYSGVCIHIFFNILFCLGWILNYRNIWTMFNYCTIQWGPSYHCMLRNTFLQFYQCWNLWFVLYRNLICLMFVLSGQHLCRVLKQMWLMLMKFFTLTLFSLAYCEPCGVFAYKQIIPDNVCICLFLNII